ncbi:MAG: hypothetical protein QM529_04205 [Hydrotalea sp.]|nr:hypothetical protein [Hydrotalea sp.]
MKNITAKSIHQSITAAATIGALLGMAHSNLAHAATESVISTATDKAPAKTTTYLPASKDGFYIGASAQVFLVDPKYTKGASVIGVGVGDGVGINLGYRIQNFLIDLAADYQFYGGKGSVSQQYATTGNGALVRTFFPEAANTSYITNVNNQETFAPITLGLKYAIPVMANGLLSITPGIAAGVWLHDVKRDISFSDSQGGELATKINKLGRGLGQFIPTSDNTGQTRAVIIPSLAVDYSPAKNITLSVTGKFYIVPGGYSDNYNKANQKASAEGVGTFTTDYNAVDKLFWYGGIDLAARYTF